MNRSLSRGFVARSLAVLGLGVILAWSAYHSLIAAPAGFPTDYHLTIDHGQSLFSVSHELESANIIRSPRVFEMLMLTLGSDKQITEGEYYFESPTTVFEVALRISGKQFGIARQKVTFPEGFTTREMAQRLSATFPSFDAALFLELAGDEEGYLFPDTYGFFASTKADVVVTTLRRNFDTKVGPLATEITASGKTEHDIIVMASLIEKEANGTDDRAVIAGILWKRMSLGMPLQVDAPFLYLLGKESKDLTAKDLAIKSPYNTYINKGLPPTPINNPGLAAITAAIHPSDSPYLYYLHDTDGAIHYGRTFAEHKANIVKYLK